MYWLASSLCPGRAGIVGAVERAAFFDSIFA